MRLRLGLVLLTALPLTVLPSFAAVTEPVVNDRIQIASPKPEQAAKWYADVFGVWPAFRDQKVIGGSP